MATEVELGGVRDGGRSPYGKEGLENLLENTKTTQNNRQTLYHDICMNFGGQDGNSQGPGDLLLGCNSPGPMKLRVATVKYTRDLTGATRVAKSYRLSKQNPIHSCTRKGLHFGGRLYNRRVATLNSPPHTYSNPNAMVVYGLGPHMALNQKV